ncbi:uncharacterized protein LOC123682616 [Harmonia axyridis]|uniref:uncharacterized protein LOC123682616 n=1 Tax=Harmonia axyridis TaxID=115357 RepID=UPI001E27652E|nr:uncharacterized protein LOC123682616 [Harmonia axyridis]
MTTSGRANNHLLMRRMLNNNTQVKTDHHGFWFSELAFIFDNGNPFTGKLHLRYQERKPLPVGPLGITILTDDQPANFFLNKTDFQIKGVSFARAESVSLNYKRCGRPDQDVTIIFPCYKSKNFFLDALTGRISPKNPNEEPSTTDEVFV